MKYPSAPRARIATLEEFRNRLARLAVGAMGRAGSPYRAGYMQALRDAGVDVFHVRARIGGYETNTGGDHG